MKSPLASSTATNAAEPPIPTLADEPRHGPLGRLIATSVWWVWLLVLAAHVVVPAAGAEAVKAAVVSQPASLDDLTLKAATEALTALDQEGVPPVRLLGATVYGHSFRINLGSELLGLGVDSPPFRAVLQRISGQVGERVYPLLFGESSADVVYEWQVEGRPLGLVLGDAAPSSHGIAKPAGLPALQGLSGRRIALSPGHGYYYNSTAWVLQRDNYFGIVEDFINSDLVAELTQQLSAAGVEVKPTRELDKNAGNGESGKPRWQEAARYHLKSLGVSAGIWNEAGYSKQYDQDIRCRPLYANSINADVLVSLHNNGGGGTGTEILYDTSNGFGAESKRLAEIMQRRLREAIQGKYLATWRDRGLVGSDGEKGENRIATRPSIIIELAFMDKQSPDNAALQNAGFRTIATQAIKAGLDEYFGGGADTTAPIITSFYPNPTSFQAGETTTIHFTVSDSGGSGLKQAVLMRNDVSDGEFDTHWVAVATKNLSGNGPTTDKFTDNPGAGDHWYGLHVIDQAGNELDERTAKLGPDKVTVTQKPSCSYALSVASGNHGATAGNGSFNVIVAAGCAWTASPSTGWIHTSSNGSGNGPVNYTVDANASSSQRIGSINVEGQVFDVKQSGADSQGPALTIGSPAGDTTVTSASLLVSGTASDSGSGNNGVSSVTVNGQNANAGTATGANTANWNATVALVPGANTITVVASDGFNNPTTRTVSATYKVEKSLVRFAAASGTPGSGVVVPVEIVSQSMENGLGGSVGFDPSKLTFDGAELGADAAGAQLVVNAAQATSGRVGLNVARGAGQTFAAGVRQVLRLKFTLKAGLTDTSLALAFSDSPVAREVSSASAGALPAEFKDGNIAVTVIAGFEADVMPRSNGGIDGRVIVTDWVQVGRFAAGLDTAALGGEFQRADCAPRATSGDGRIGTTDWVQAGRYAAGLDPVAPAGGPSAPGAVATEGRARPAAPSVAREFQFVSATAAVGEVVSLPIEVEASGDENAISFSMTFDPAQVSYAGFTLVNAFSGITPISNLIQQAEGRVGFLFGLPFGQGLPAGKTKIGVLQLRVLPAAAGQSVAVAFGDAPIARELSNTVAGSLPANWTAGTVTVSGPPVPPASPSRLSGLVLGDSTVEMLLRGDVGERYVIETSADLRDWTTVATQVVPDGGSLRVTVPRTVDGPRYFRATPAASPDGPFTLQPGPTDGKDLWTTSFYSHTADGNSFPGGGKNDHQLRVGGWGDLYYSLLEFDLTSAPKQAGSAVLYLYCFHQSGGGTPMDLYRITEPWDWRTQGTGRDRERLWWADRPAAEKWNSAELPVPVPGQWYAVDITGLYKAWQSGAQPNHGLQLQPLRVSNDNFNEFYSADHANAPELRPKLVVTPVDPVAPGPELVVEGLEGPALLVADGSHLYFTDNPLDGGVVKRVTKSPGTPETLATGVAIFDAGSWRGASALQVSGDSVFGHYGGYERLNIFDLPKSGGVAATRWSGSGAGFIGAQGGQLYFSAGFSSINRQALPSGDPVPLAGGVWARSTRLDADAIYFVEYHSRDVRRLDLKTSAVTTLLGGNPKEGLLSADAANLYYALDGGSITRLPKAGGTPTVLVPSGARAFMASDGAGLYYVAVDRSLRRVDLASGAEAVFTTALMNPNDDTFLAVDESHVYWTDSSAGRGAGVIWRARKR